MTRKKIIPTCLNPLFMRDYDINKGLKTVDKMTNALYTLYENILEDLEIENEPEDVLKPDYINLLIWVVNNDSDILEWINNDLVYLQSLCYGLHPEYSEDNVRSITNKELLSVINTRIFEIHTDMTNNPKYKVYKNGAIAKV